MSLPPWSFLPMGIGEPQCDCLDLMIFDLGEALVGRRLHLGDTLPRRRLHLGDALPRRRLVLTLTPGVDFELDFVNARIRDDTGFLGCAPSVDIFLHFFEVKRQRNNLWVTLSNVPGRVLFTPFQHSFTGWKGKFFKVCCSDLVLSALDGFPPYWVQEARALKSKSLKRFPLNDREACRILAAAGGFDAAALISLEYNAEALEKYICMLDSPHNLPFLAFAGFLHDLSCSGLVCARLSPCLSPLAQVRK